MFMNIFDGEKYIGNSKKVLELISTVWYLILYKCNKASLNVSRDTKFSE